MKRQETNTPPRNTMEMITYALRGVIRWVRLLGSPRSIVNPVPEASWIANSRMNAMQEGVTPPIIVRYTFRVRLCPTTSDNFTSKYRN
jgi:hypothetical protein